MKVWQKPCPTCGTPICRKAAGCREHSPILRGPQPHRWSKDGAAYVGRDQARKLYPVLGTCQHCEGASAEDRHHIDGNTFNNEPENIALLCKKCHSEVEGRSDHLRRLAASQRKFHTCPVCTIVVSGRKWWLGRCMNCASYWRTHGIERYDEQGNPRPGVRKVA